MSSPSTTETSTRSRRRGAELIDPESLMRIKSLHARARAVVEGFLSGIHRSPFHGFSAEFSEYREYSPGDDLRYLDWRLYARSDRYYVKRFEDETNLRCYLLVDVSRSMGYGSSNVSKDPMPVPRRPRWPTSLTSNVTRSACLPLHRKYCMRSRHVTVPGTCSG